MEYDIRAYDETKKSEWDDFIFDRSINGVFLQSRKFLDYHPKGRFTDCSIMVYKKDKLVAVCPACVVFEDGKKVFASHQGSTYGGLVIDPSISRLESLFTLVDEFEIFLRGDRFDKIYLKPTLSIFCKDNEDLLFFTFTQKGYTEYKELNLYIDLEDYNKEDIISNFSKLKKRQVKKCIDNGIGLRELVEREQIKGFHDVLSENLKKYGRRPVHTLDELMDLKFNRFPEWIHFYGAYYDESIVAGTMVFEFPDRLCAHTQYLAALNLENISPMSFIYYSMVELFAENGYKYLSWGIATEHLGEEINWGLMRNKEEFGSRHCINYIYGKEL